MRWHPFMLSWLITAEALLSAISMALMVAKDSHKNYHKFKTLLPGVVMINRLDNEVLTLNISMIPIIPG